MNLYISILLPTYNEAENIIPLIQTINEVIPQKKEIIVIDDNSPDGTSQKVNDFINRTGIKYIRLETRFRDRGLTNSIRHGIECASGDVIVWMDCDFSHPPEIIPLLLKKIEEGFDIAVASRFIPGGKTKTAGVNDSLNGIILSNFLNATMYILFRNNFHDYTSGFVAVRKRVFDTIQLRGDYGEYFIEFIVSAYRNKFRVSEVPYTSTPRRAGISKTGQTLMDYLKRGRKYLYTVIRLRYENH